MGWIDKALNEARQKRESDGSPKKKVASKPKRTAKAAPPEVQPAPQQKPAPAQRVQEPSKSRAQVSTLRSKQVFKPARQVEVNQQILQQNRILTSVQDPGITSAYKMLRTRVLQRMRANNWNSLAVTSTAPGDGKTTTSINLAISLAKNVNHNVFLVDLDLRRPSIHRYFGFKPKRGLGDYLLGKASPEDIVVDPGVERLNIIPNDHPFDNSSEQLSSPKMLKLVEYLTTSDPSRIIVFDTPPLLVTDDMLAFSPYIDAIMLVVSEGKTKREEIQRATHLLQDTNVLGTVLNRSSESASGYGYGYYY